MNANNQVQRSGMPNASYPRLAFWTARAPRRFSHSPISSSQFSILGYQFRPSPLWALCPLRALCQSPAQTSNPTLPNSRLFPPFIGYSRIFFCETAKLMDLGGFRGRGVAVNRSRIRHAQRLIAFLDPIPFEPFFQLHHFGIGHITKMPLRLAEMSRVQLDSR